MKKISIVLLCGVGLLALIPPAMADDRADLAELKGVADKVKSDLYGTIKGGVVRRLKQAGPKDYEKVYKAQDAKLRGIKKELATLEMTKGPVGKLAVTMKKIIKPLLEDVHGLIEVSEAVYDAIKALREEG